MLSSIFNWSFSSGVFPSALKTALITPIYKSGDQHTLSNYRPISILPAISKILEKLANNRLNDFLTANQLLFVNQHGFRSNHSAEIAVTELVDEISACLDNKELSVGIFVDLSKAFDTINHSLLLKKLTHYGIRGIAWEWFHSYLSKRSQQVSINNIISNPLSITCGVPQGSILGPSLFLLYINDIYKTSTLARFILYADDTNIFLSHKNPSKLFKLVSTEFTKVLEWFKINKLSVILTKPTL